MSNTLENIFSNSLNWGSQRKSKLFSYITKILLVIAVLSGVLFTIVWATKEVFDFVVGTKTLITITAIAEIVVLIKTSAQDVPRMFSMDEVVDMAEGEGVKKYFKKVVSIFCGVLKTQCLLILPFFIAYALIRNADFIFFVNCAITIFALGIIIAVWAILIFVAVNSIKKCRPNMSKTHEILLFVAFLFVSVIGFVTCKGYSIDSLLMHIVEIFKQILLTSDALTVSINSNIMLFLNIFMLLLVLQGIVYVINVICYSKEDEVTEKSVKIEYVVLKETRKHYNDILRSCLARSPTN